YRQRIVRSDRQVAAQIARTVARSSGEPDEAQFRSERRRDDAARAKSILQSGVFIINIAQRADLALQPIALIAHRGGMFRRDVVRKGGGRYHIHEEAMTEGGMVRAQHFLFQSRELRETESKAAIVAEITEIAQVIRDPLAFET